MTRTMRLATIPEGPSMMRISREIQRFGFRAENSLRPFVCGRKNWLFAGTVAGAQASSVVYSVIESAKANGLKPFEYLEFLFTTLPNATSSMIDAILPWGDAIPQRCKLAVMEY